MKRRIKSAMRHLLPSPVYRWLHKAYSKTRAGLRGQTYVPPLGLVDFGDLRRLKPISELEGYERGLPVDRYYIEKFLASNSRHIAGHVLEIGDDEYTKKFGKDRVEKSDILNYDKSFNPRTTIEADLSSAPHISSDTFDCIIFTQTLQFIYDMHSAIGTLKRILKPGGVLLATLGGIGNTYGIGPSEGNWHWLFTASSASRIFLEEFPDTGMEITPHGNVLAAIGFLEGLSLQEFSESELDYYDPRYQMLITVKATKK
ncbi:MAG: methyltransferase domain-containing protein [Candidatus Dadabacteria bacterium]